MRADAKSTTDAFTTVADFAPGMMWISRADGSRTFFNRRWLEFTGRSIRQEIGRGWTRAVHAADRQSCRAAYRAVIRSGLPFELEYRLRRADGEYRYVVDRASPRLADGEVVGFIGSCLDVTNRKAAELELRASEMRFRLLAENASDMIYRYRLFPTYQSEYVSPAVTMLTGHTPEEFMADPELAFRLIHRDDRSLALAIRKDPKRFREPIILRWVHDDGRIVQVEHRNVPVFDSHGRLVALEGIGRDVTDRLAIETRLRASERRMRQLAASVEQARENERRDIARELHDELGQSLTAIKLELARTVQALTKRQLPPESLDSLQSMFGGIDVAIETVRRLATSLRPPALDYLGLVAAIETEAAVIARRTGIRCQVTGNRNVPQLDPEQTTAVFRIVQEALTNVVRHASASSVKIRIDGTPAGVSVKVQDNGRGARLKEQADRSALGVLGMRERAEMIGGALAITSAPGKGTSVSFALDGIPGKRRAPRV
ncbi:MAG TPA: PAS domain-containing protein [Vicinamibacterales bacterium]|nr:PAS domain-containing protein [Vicinamibacterales bacterium]